MMKQILACLTLYIALITPVFSTIHHLHQAIENHDTTCEAIINHYLKRIKSYNLSPNTIPLNALTEINVNAIEQAKKIDQTFYKTGKLTGKLHCIPVVLKDNIDAYDSTSTQGSLALLGNQPTKDAFLVSQLRQAGAVIIGKGAMDEFASGMFGLSSRNGRIGNAYNTEQNPGGSSGGSAVAVSVNFAVLGIGTDNSGSIRIPAAFNGIYGLRPSTGLISQRGIFPTGNLDGTAGPLARTVEDLAILLDVIAKADPLDKKTSIAPRVNTYQKYLNPQGLKNKRIGIVRLVGMIDPFKSMPKDITKMVDKSLQSMKNSGVTFIDNIDLSAFNTNRNHNMAGMKQDIDDYLQSYPAVRKNFRDICESNRTRVFGRTNSCLKFMNSLPPKFGTEYNKALKIIDKNKQYVENIMNKQHLDLLLIPISTVGSASYDPNKINTWLAPISSNAGLPAITINLGYTASQMPVGIELIGKKYAEGTLIETAYAYEKNSPPRIAPKMPEKDIASANLNLSEYNNVLTEIGYQSYIKKFKEASWSKRVIYFTPAVFKEMISQQRLRQ